MIIPAYHLPQLDDVDFEEWDERAAGDVVLRTPWLEPGHVARIAVRLRTAQEQLLARDVDSIIRVIDRVAHRLLDRRDALRNRAESALPAITGYSPAMIRHILDGMAADWRRPALERLITAELGGTDTLDRTVERDGRRTIALPYPLLLHVFAGNIPGVAVTSLVRALLVRAASFGKAAAGEPLLPALFAQAVAEEDARLGDALAVAYWPGGDEAIEEVAFRAADAIVAYGSARALEGIRTRAPAHLPVLDHGPRLSIGFVTRDALRDRTALARLAADVARSVATFDQQGCVSPHAVYVEEGDFGAAEFAALITDALLEIESDLPRGKLTPDEAAAVRDLRTRAEFGALGGRTSQLVSPPDAPFTVILHDVASFEPSCLQRTIHVHAVTSVADAVAALQPHRALLQSAAVAGADDGTVRRIAHSGFTRITSFAHMPWPDAASHHDGRGPLTELLRFIAVEIP